MLGLHVGLVLACTPARYVCRVQTMIYEVNLSLPEVYLNLRLLFRGAWARTDAREELDYKTCRNMGNYIERARAISIHMVHARPLLLGLLPLVRR